MNLDKVLDKLVTLESEIENNLKDKELAKNIERQFDYVFEEVMSIQDQLVEIQHVISKLTY